MSKFLTIKECIDKIQDKCITEEDVLILNYLKNMQKHIIPDTFPKIFTDDYYNYMHSISLPHSIISGVCLTITSESCYPALAWDWIKELADIIGNKTVLSVCSGLGALEKCLKDCSVNIIATDLFLCMQDNYIFEDRMSWMDIEKIDAVDAISKYGKDINYLLLSWSPYRNTIDYDCLMKLRETNPNARIICITEEYGGCVGSDQFYEEAEEVVDSINQITIPQWYGIHDGLYVYK